jgi:REP element-mobilizing transposase RayT
MSTGYHIDEPDGLYFVTLQVVDWVDVFTRQAYKDILIDNLAYCQKHKGLTLFAYVVMSNHVHMLVQSQNRNLSGTLRDFKSFTSKVIINTIEQGNESRKAWMLRQFLNAASTHRRNSHYQFWTHENHAEHIYSDKFMEQKIEYIHQNPVRAGYVRLPEDYIYSSASNYAGLPSVLDVEILPLVWKTI